MDCPDHVTSIIVITIHLKISDKNKFFVPEKHGQKSKEILSNSTENLF